MSPDIFRHYKTGISELDKSNWAILHPLSNAITFYDSNNRDEVIRNVNETLQLLSKVLIDESHNMESISYPYSDCRSASYKSLISELRGIISKINIDSRHMSIRYTVGLWERSFLEHVDLYDSQWAAYLDRQQK